MPDGVEANLARRRELACELNVEVKMRLRTLLLLVVVSLSACASKSSDVPKVVSGILAPAEGRRPTLTEPASIAVAEERPANDALPVPLQALLREWFRTDCGVGGTGQVRKDMLAAGVALEPALLEAIRLGPDEEMRADVRANAEYMYALRQRALLQGVTTNNETWSQRLLAQSIDEYVAEEMARRASGWRDSAVLGLEFACTKESLQVLRQIAENSNDVASTTARQTLARTKDCSRAR